MERSVIGVVVALALALAALAWAGALHRRLGRLEREQGALRMRLAELGAGADDETEDPRREIGLRADDLLQRVRRLRACAPTPEGIRGAQLWAERELHELLRLAGRVGDEAALSAALAVDALSHGEELLRPHLARRAGGDPAPFAPEELAASLDEAEAALVELTGRLGPRGR